jgi:hypothetical protein
MSRSALALLPILLALSPHRAAAQEHYTLGPISRVILIDIKPGKATEFWTDLRQTLRPLFDQYKQQGLIQDYSVGLKTTTEGPQDWDVSVILTFKNWAALDTFSTKGDSVSKQYYGDYAKRSGAGARRAEFSTLVGSFLVRHVDLKPMAKATSR